MPFPCISTPVFVIPLDEGSILYFPLRKGAFLGDRALVSLISRWQQAPFEAKTPDEAALAKLLDRMGILGPDKDAPPKNPAAPLPAYHATLFATLRCNLNCTYCYAAPRLKGPDMDLPLALAAIDFAAKNARAAKKGFFSVSFHGGGEPTANWRLIKAATLHAQKIAAQNKLAARLFMATNGVLDSSQRRFLAEKFEGLSVSFDGLEEVQNRQRPFKNGRPTYARVLETLARLAEKGMPLGIRMTATRFSLPLLAQSAAFVAAKGFAKNILIEPVFALGKGAQTGMETDPASFAAAFLEASAAAGAYGATVSYSPARLEKLALSYCGAGAKNFCLMPGGQISACAQVFDPRIADAPLWTVGQASKKGLLLDDEHRKKIALAIETYKEKWCSQCFARWHCAGDCPRLALQADSQNAPAPNPKRCQATKAILTGKILEKINASNKVYWSGLQADD